MKTVYSLLLTGRIQPLPPMDFMPLTQTVSTWRKHIGDLWVTTSREKWSVKYCHVQCMAVMNRRIIMSILRPPPRLPGPASIASREFGYYSSASRKELWAWSGTNTQSLHPAWFLLDVVTWRTKTVLAHPTNTSLKLRVVPSHARETW